MGFRILISQSDDLVGDHEMAFIVTRSHYAVFEAQGRGSLHFHMLLWAGISPHLLDSVMHKLL